ncbi:MULTISPECIES: glycosyltransferase family 4 protein [unclassified Nostoc]|uniref:glycosyltransferase family 4 protein n=1 Tax=unclassified Nostoc TaxID=2593658 RepID=UPI0013D2C1C9|nr:MULTISPECIES: glycosyltransferase family 4 protein [unclassified Nostoc]MBE8998644.1 glycosyltransferase family 4 protein [Nostoc sp. LEGE 12447]NEU79756.1 glycosyltransferase [Nostoc sp. UIC 10630]
MNVLHINQSDIGGGAAIAGYRLHQGLLQQGVNSKLLVGKVKTDSSLVAAVGHKYRVENQLLRLTRRLGLNYLHLLSTFDIWKHDFYEQADIINFHNLHTGYFNYLGIPGLTKSKPAIFTLHDMWSFTGHCAYSYDCDRWQQGCGQCPYPETYPEIARDNTRLEWQLKDWVYSKSNLTIVTPSQWLTEQAKKSILNRFSIYHIPYGLNTDAYQPLEKDKCKNILGIPADKKVIMFCADGLEDSRKGGDLLVQAIQTLPKALKAETLLLTLGSGGEKVLEVVGIPTLNLGYVSGDRMKSIAYSAADVFIFPTRADNLPLVLQESMACGTPMVSFKVGGVPDLVRPGITGYLAQPEDTQDFCNGIVQLLVDREQLHKMSENCRAIALQEYTLELQTKRYIELYQQVLQSP